MKDEMHTLVLDIPGERPRKHFCPTKNHAYHLARQYLFEKGMVTIFDPSGKEIYRHAKPFTRKHFHERIAK